MTRIAPTETIEIACQVRRQTDKAWLIYDGTKEVWLPTSQITDHTTTQGLFGEKITSVFVPVWLATEKGLV